ncbi:MAG: BlaI/MecI/CopY family transcriptional regulator [Saprospiraceae bacterium]|nr:BlaI/MecI/CopY family transcriptional regulator [Saprospiraceae bacterium]
MRHLNEKEEAIMQVLWRLKRAFVKEILDELPPPKPPITTISSTVRKLEAEGWLSHDAFGKSHRYFPKLEKSEYRNNSMKQMIKKYFGGSPTQVLSYFLEEKEIAPEELEQLLQQIKNKES